MAVSMVTTAHSLGNNSNTVWGICVVLTCTHIHASLLPQPLPSRCSQHNCPYPSCSTGLKCPPCWMFSCRWCLPLCMWMGPWTLWTISTWLGAPCTCLHMVSFSSTVAVSCCLRATREGEGRREEGRGEDSNEATRHLILELPCTSTLYVPCLHIMCTCIEWHWQLLTPLLLL